MAIGQRVFVDSAGSRSGSVALSDVSGKIASAVHLPDGSEVQVVAWRPRGANETRYRVQGPQGVDGWLPAENLRSTLVAVPRVEPASMPDARLVTADGTRPFGQRRHTERPSDTPVPEQVAPSVADSVGRRFGQH
jgi:hypothetical protein